MPLTTAQMELQLRWLSPGSWHWAPAHKQHQAACVGRTAPRRLACTQVPRSRRQPSTQCPAWQVCSKGAACSTQPQAAPPTCMPHEAASLNHASNSCMGPASAIWTWAREGEGSNVLAIQSRPAGQGRAGGAAGWEPLPHIQTLPNPMPPGTWLADATHSHPTPQAPPYASVELSRCHLTPCSCAAPAQAGHLPAICNNSRLLHKQAT